MIRLINTSSATEVYHRIVPTIFPDKTSQVWKIPYIETMTSCYIQWNFEQEVELIWLNQLLALLKKYKVTVAELHIPYLPYARQDKEVGNNNTFARDVFLDMLDTELPFEITTLDAHSPCNKIISLSPEKYIQYAVNAFKPSVIVFPDKGAAARYSVLSCLSKFPHMVMDKTRDQTTGEITGLTTDFVLENRVLTGRYLIVDDICDGGATFIRVADYINQRARNAKIALYTTHGIYSNGKSVLKAAGIGQLFSAPTLGN
jgi:ribose-phosphate pyrophosphokinase